MTLYEQFAEYTSGNDVFENDDDKESVLAVVNLYEDHPELGIKTINHSPNLHCDPYIYEYIRRRHHELMMERIEKEYR
mgnify:FL=1